MPYIVQLNNQTQKWDVLEAETGILVASFDDQDQAMRFCKYSNVDYGVE